VLPVVVLLLLFVVVVWVVADDPSKGDVTIALCCANVEAVSVAGVVVADEVCPEVVVLVEFVELPELDTRLLPGTVSVDSTRPTRTVRFFAAFSASAWLEEVATWLAVVAEVMNSEMWISFPTSPTVRLKPTGEVARTVRVSSSSSRREVRFRFGTGRPRRPKETRWRMDRMGTPSMILVSAFRHL
jgi:hypothetical protein